MKSLSEDFRAHLRMFAFFLVNGTLGGELLFEFDYSDVLDTPSNVEMIFAIWSNNLRLDDGGKVLNDRDATRRAAQYIRTFVDKDYVADPPFADWETELH